MKQRATTVQTVCGACGQEVGREAKTCPHCGAPVRRRRIIHWLVLLVLVAIIVGGIYREDDGRGWKPSPASVAKQGDRLQAVQRLIDEGIAERFQADKCVLWVTPAFLALDFEAKQDVLNPVWSYCIVESSSYYATLALNDSVSGGQIGYVNQYGLRLY